MGRTMRNFATLLRPIQTARLLRPVQTAGHSVQTAGHSSQSAAHFPTKPNRNYSGMAFPCLDRAEERTRKIQDNGPEPAYSRVGGYSLYKTDSPILLDYGNWLPRAQIAYETWGTLNDSRSNAILLHTGLSASSHAASHAKNTAPGWWEDFVGPGKSIDTRKFFVVCTNVLGGCFGSTGPMSAAADGEPYATRFPILTINDMVRVQERFMRENFGIEKLYASVGSSMGGMQSLALARDFPDFVGRVASISGCARSHPSSIAMRHVQRQALMADKNWNRGFYYKGVPPHSGMKLAREIATITYRSGPEWEERFDRERADPSKPPAFCPDFLIETYLDHQGEKFCLEYDPNSLLYVSKAMDLFDLGESCMIARSLARKRAFPYSAQYELSCTVPERPYEDQPRTGPHRAAWPDLVEGLKPMARIPTFVLGVQSDALFPVRQQQEVAEAVREAAGPKGYVEYHEVGYDVSLFGHDTFLLDFEHVGRPLRAFLEL